MIESRYRAFLALWVAGTVLLQMVGGPAARADDVSASAITARFSSDLEALYKLNKSESYSTKQSPKALAICVDYHGFVYSDGRLKYNLPFMAINSPIRRYQYASQKTLLEARDAALQACRPYEKKVCQCEIFAENDAVIYKAPDNVLARLAAAKAEDEAYTVIADDIASRMMKSPAQHAPADVELGAGKNLTVEPIGCSRQYDCVCRKRFRNGLIALSEGHTASELLARIRSARLYDCREESSLLPDSIFPYSRKVCHFVAAVRKPHTPVGLLTPDVQGQQFDEALYEGAIPVDKDLDPADEPVDGRRLVYARRGSQEFLGIAKRIPDPEFSCAVSTTFTGKIFDLRKCADPLKCGNLASAALSAAFAKRMVTHPFSAEAVPNGLLIPGEVSFHRKRKPSEILQGPFWELSIYNLNWWQSDGYTVAYPDQEEYRGANERGKSIYSRVTSSIGVSVGNGPKYADPDDWQQTRYDDVILGAFRSALKESCEALKGTYTGDVCTMGAQQ